ncbi:hypothetical protein D3C80_1787120 [compost metagenome]
MVSLYGAVPARLSLPPLFWLPLYNVLPLASLTCNQQSAENSITSALGSTAGAVTPASAVGNGAVGAAGVVSGSVVWLGETTAGCCAVALPLTAGV